MTAKLSTVREIIEEIRSEGAVTVNQQLERLIDKFTIAARAIDPSINNIWVGRAGDDLQQPFWIHMDRENTPFVRRSKR